MQPPAASVYRCGVWRVCSTAVRSARSRPGRSVFDSPLSAPPPAPSEGRAPPCLENKNSADGNLQTAIFRSNQAARLWCALWALYSVSGSPGPPGPLCFLVFVFSRPPAASDPPGRALNGESKTLRPAAAAAPLLHCRPHTRPSSALTPAPPLARPLPDRRPRCRRHSAPRLSSSLSDRILQSS